MTWFKKYFYLLPVLLYLPALGNFFSGDDWFHLRISQIDSFQQFFNFFSFAQNDHTASFYRPLSTQVFFYIFQKLFGLTAWPYYLFGLLLFAYSIYLVRKFSTQYLKSEICDLTSAIYGLSASNFTRVYFLSAYQELFLVIFSLLTLINFKTKPQKSLLFFVLALFSKETAIVLPLLVVIMNFKYIKNNFLHLRSIIYSTTILSIVYLNYRLLHFGLAAGDSYLWNFSPVKAANTLMWYVLWSFGAPELLVDYVGSSMRLIPRFFADYATWWPVIIFPLVATILLTIYSMIRHCASPANVGAKAVPARIDLSQARRLLQYFVIRNDKLIKFILFFLIALLPVLFLPSHKFALELGLPLIGFSLALSTMIVSAPRTSHYALITIFILYNLSMNYLTFTRHYSVSRGEISKKVYSYFQEKYPEYPKGKQFFFINDAKDYGNIWGQSRQVSQAVSNSDMFRVIYKDVGVKVLYEDVDGREKQNNDTIPIGTAQFLNQ